MLKTLYRKKSEVSLVSLYACERKTWQLRTEEWADTLLRKHLRIPRLWVYGVPKIIFPTIFHPSLRKRPVDIILWYFIHSLDIDVSKFSMLWISIIFMCHTAIRSAALPSISIYYGTFFLVPSCNLFLFCRNVPFSRGFTRHCSGNFKSHAPIDLFLAVYLPMSRLCRLLLQRANCWKC